MRKYIIVLTGGLVISTFAFLAAAYAAEDLNSSRSNVSSEIEVKPFDVTYTYNLNISVQKAPEYMSDEQFERFLDIVLATAKQDLLAQRSRSKGRE